MPVKEVDVTCPCCSARLTVDVLSGQVLRKKPAQKEGEGAAPKDAWEAAQERVRGRSSDSAKKLEGALEYERTKEARFDELFRKATEKNAPKPDDE